MKKYKARMGSALTNAEAQIFGNIVEEITKKKGKVTPKQIIKEAQNKNSPLHSFFEWDDSVAGEKYRLQQARNLISGIVEVTDIEGKRKEIRSFFSVSDGKGRQKAYVPLKKVLNNKKPLNEVLGRTITMMENATDLLRLLRSNQK